MAGAIFLEIDGIKGESQFSGHEGQIDVESWSWGVTQPHSTHSGGGGASGRANVSDLQIQHKLDKASPNLAKYCFNGKHITKAVLIQREAGGDETVPYLKLTLHDFLISSYNSSSAGEGKPMESVSLNFAKIEIEYQEQDKDGKKKGGPVSANFDVKTNKAG
jgi:type VI secretion system secreted protein Hcp